jgi:hypothetical protein
MQLIATDIIGLPKCHHTKSVGYAILIPGRKTPNNLMTLEEILQEYGQEVLDTYYELFPDKNISKFGDRCCGFVGEYQDFVLDCYHSTGSDELETLEDFMNGVFQEYYYYCEKTATGFVFYNEDR